MENIFSVPVLPIEWYIDVEKNRKTKALEASAGNQEELQVYEMVNIHNKCIFDALNDAFDYNRPFGIEGPQLPWSTKLRDLSYCLPQVDTILFKTKEKVLSWCKVKAGCICDSESAPATETVNTVRMQKEEKLACILIGEVWC